jgi:phenylacetate-CoA ligase
MDKAGLKPSHIQMIEDLAKIPITSKGELAAMQKADPPFGGLLTMPPEHLRRIYCSPGPIFHAEFYGEYAKGFAKSFYAGGLRKGDIVIVTTSYHMVPAGLLVDGAFELLGITVVPAGTGNTEITMEVARQTKCTGYLGFPSFLMSFIKAAETKGYAFKKEFAIRKALVGGEPLPKELRKSFQDDYGIRTTHFYANAEQGVLGYECSRQNGFHVVDELIVEVVDPETGKQVEPGEVGEVVMTNFVKTYPLIRLGTGDLSMYTDEPCPCGRTTFRLLRIVGRIGANVLRVKGLFLYLHDVQRVISEFPQIKDFQIAARRSGYLDQIIVRLELRQGDADQDLLTKELSESFVRICRLKPSRIEFISEGVFREGHQYLADERSWE